MTQPYYLLIAGGRDFDDFELMKRVIEERLSQLGDRVVVFVSGKSRGADALGCKYALDNGYECVEMPADWSTGLSAGHIRNYEMGKLADEALIFWDGTSKGTAGMIKVMQGFNKKFAIIRYGAPAPLGQLGLF